MKMILDKEEFLKTVQTAGRFTSQRLSTVQSLQGALFVIENSTLSVYATDLNTHFHAKLKPKTPIKEKGRFILDPKKVAEFLALLSAGDVSLEVEDRKVVLKKEKTKGSFIMMGADDFPLPPVLAEKALTLNTEQFKKTLPYVLFSASRDDSRPALTGVNFLSQDGELLMVATDGFRLSLLKEKNTQKIPSMLIPGSFLAEILQGIKSEKSIEFTVSDKEKIVRFVVGDNSYFSRVLEGDFPPFEKVIPAEKKQTITTDREEFVRNVKIASLFAREQSNIVILRAEKGVLEIKPKTDSEGDNGSSQDAVVEGEAIQVAFNAKFLLDFLQNTSGKKTIIELLRSDAPTVFKADNEKNFLHIIMPVRIQS
jgi:DNA polymerase III subunit beta